MQTEPGIEVEAQDSAQHVPSRLCSPCPPPPQPRATAAASSHLPVSLLSGRVRDSNTPLGVCARIGRV